MPNTIILHIANSDPVVGECDELPTPGDRLIKITNPRRMDGKDLHYLAENVTTVYFPVEKINFIEVLPGADEEEIIGFFRKEPGEL